MYSRICIIGRPGSGKSRLAYLLHKKLNISVYYLDLLKFQNNWVKCSDEDFARKQQEIITQDRWIIEGCGLRSLEMRYKASEICIYLNYSRWLCLFRFCKRVLFGQDKNIHDVPKGCKETLSWDVIKYLWTFESRNNYFILHLLKKLQSEYPQTKFIEINSDHELKLFLDSM